MLYLYGISESPHPPSVRGLQGAELSVGGEGGVFGVWSEHSDPRLEADETILWEHEQVVEALLEEGTMLPMRFGTWLPDREAVLRVLRERQDEFALGLDRVRDAVEIGVRAMVHSERAEPALAPSGGERPGTAYMLARLNDEQRSTALAARIHEPLEALARASTPRRTSLSGSVNTAYLVDRDDVAPFQATIEKLDAVVDGATVVCTGPWPPYSFTPQGRRT